MNLFMQKHKYPKYLLALVLIRALSFVCVVFLRGKSFVVFAQSSSAQNEKSSLEKELAELELKISQYERDITITQQQKNSLQNEIAVIKKKIGQLDLQIKKSNIVIQDLGVQIQDTE